MGKRIAAIVLFFVVISLAWMVLGGVTSTRSHKFHSRLSNEVSGLWGQAQVQQAPDLDFVWWSTRTVTEEVTDPATKHTTLVKKIERVANHTPVLINSSDVAVDFDLEHRKKGLLWYATYAVDFAADYTYTHESKTAGTLNIRFQFPTFNATYDDFVFLVNGQADDSLAPGPASGNPTFLRQLPVQPGDRVAFTLAYKSRGLDFWRYAFGPNVNRVQQFNLAMNTNFDAIDFPDGTISPTTKDKTDDGWHLTWGFTNLISGFDIGMDMPKKLNPGPLAAQISLFAPVSLLFFFVWMFVITVLKKIELHPMNYLFLGAAFFAFHLLFTYTVERIPLTVAFGISSLVSVFLVISYLRLVVGLRFAAVEAGLAQIVYLVLFSYAHFYQGWTGLIVTVGSILTLFVIMQLTGRIDWAATFDPSRRKQPEQPPAALPEP